MHHASRYYWIALGAFILAFGGGTLAAFEDFPLGILGATGRATPNLSHIELIAVHDGSPAHQAGLQTGDRITGIAGRLFPPHTDNVDDGGNGPQRILGEALDDVAANQAEADRQLPLLVVRSKESDAKENDTKVEELTCPLPYRPSVLQEPGRRQLLQRAASHLRKTCHPKGYWNAPVGLSGDRVLTAWATIAINSLGDPLDADLLRRCRLWLQGPEERAWLQEDPLKKGPDNLGNWALTATAVALVEGCEGQPSPSEKKTLQLLCETLQQRMNDQGRFGHDVVVGYSGKGFNVINTLSHLAWAMGSKAGIPIDTPSWNLSLDQIRQSIDPNGGIRYWTMKNTGTADASLRTSSMALGLSLANQEDELVNTFSDYLDQHRSRTREAHAVGSLGMLLTPATLRRYDPAAYQRFLSEWRWYLSLMQDHQGKIHYIGGKRNNGGDSYLGTDRIACAIAIMILSPADGKLILFGT